MTNLKRSADHTKHLPRYVVFADDGRSVLGSVFRTGSLPSCYRWWASVEPELNRTYALITRSEFSKPTSSRTRTEAVAKLVAEVGDLATLVDDHRAYMDLADELNDEDVAPYEEDDWNPACVAAAKRYAGVALQPFPPGHGDFERLAEYERSARLAGA